MRIIRRIEDVTDADRGAAAAIGNFDGVHRGHQALIADARVAAADDAPVAVVTFEPHPRMLFQPEAPSFRLTTPAERRRRIAAHGVDLLFELPFDRALASMTAEDFVSEVLGAVLGLSHVAVGADFRFGKGRRGDTAMLTTVGAQHGITTHVHPLIGDDAGEFASSAVREMVREGRCEDAARQLGCWHTVSGPVVKGDQRGRDLGYPTANLSYGHQLVPRYGVYATWVDVLDGPHVGRHAGVASLGERPTFGVNAPNFEVHLFDFAGDLYGAEISVSLVKWLRGEVAFVDVPTLIAQMDRDSAEARRILITAAVPI